MALRAASLDEFVRAPFGSYYLGARFLVWVIDGKRAGTAAWGRITESDAEAIINAWRYEPLLSAPYVSIVDLQSLQGVEPDAFATIAKFMTTNLAELAARVGHQALVRPPGMPGALVAGFYPTLAPGFEWRDFASRQEAWAWCWPDDRSNAAAEVNALIETAQSSTPRLAQLRHYLNEHLHNPSLAEAARQLGCAERSLQRELSDAGTGFRAEVQTARLAAAQALLLDSDLKVAAVAKRVGFESLTSFSSLFSKRIGTTPAEFRAQKRVK